MKTLVSNKRADGDMTMHSETDPNQNPRNHSVSSYLTLLSSLVCTENKNEQKKIVKHTIGIPMRSKKTFDVRVPNVRQFLAIDPEKRLLKRHSQTWILLGQFNCLRPIQQSQAILWNSITTTKEENYKEEKISCN